MTMASNPWVEWTEKYMRKMQDEKGNLFPYSCQKMLLMWGRSKGNKCADCIYLRSKVDTALGRSKVTSQCGKSDFKKNWGGELPACMRMKANGTLKKRKTRAR